MADNARGIHVSPGVYTREVELTYAAKSLGITTLGLAGETVKGPAFQPILIESWRDYQNVFGGTNPEKFKSSQYPKYELPYIAKSYLTQSQQLYVCRVLGLSGYNAGPAWAITANISSGTDKDKKMVIAVLRSRADYSKYFKYTSNSNFGTCECETQAYDKLVYRVGEKKIDTDNCKVPVDYNMNALKLTEYKPLEDSYNECAGASTKSGVGDWAITSSNHGRFKIIGLTGRTDETSPSPEKEGYFEYAVTLNPTDKDYILKVLGTDASEGEAPIYVESLYDVAIDQLLSTDQINQIDKDLIDYQVYNVIDYCDFSPVYDLMDGHPEFSLSRRNLGQRFLATKACENSYTCHLFDYKTGKPVISGVTNVVNPNDGTIDTTKTYTTGIQYTSSGVEDYSKQLVKAGQIYTVAQYTDGNGSRKYYYRYYSTDDGYINYLASNKKADIIPIIDKLQNNPSGNTGTDVSVSAQMNSVKTTLVKNYSDDRYYKLIGTGTDAFFDSTGMISAQTVSAVSGTEAGYKYNVYSADTSLGDGITVLKETNLFSKDTSIKGTKSTVYWNDEKTQYLTATSVGFRTSGYVHTASDYIILSPTEEPVNKVFYYSYTANVSGKENTTFYSTNEVINITEGSIADVTDVQLDLNNYKSPYRYASTPWIVSNVKGDSSHIDLSKLFRFHTISDGTLSNYQVKVSIMNIKPDDGTFDVIVRDINDTDSSISALEKFSKCSLVPGTSNYLGLKIGTYDGAYESKSKYITVEINENSITENAVPAGFLGYPRQKFNGTQIGSGVSDTTNVISPIIKYNTTLDEDIKHRRQYFGLSNLIGVDVDLFTFKGNSCYVDGPEFLTQGFHLDARLEAANASSATSAVTVDGQTGYTFDSVSVQSRTVDLTELPVIGKEIEMGGSIFEYVDLRKFTVYFYGGFDGWDVFRKERSITDDFKKSNYRGTYNDATGDGYSVDKLTDPESLGLNQDGITSDWYAYLSAIRQFANPQSIDINVFATPGIDYVNNTSLVEEAIEMIEEERADSIYIVTTPDKPSGAGDYITDMYTPEDAVYNLEDTNIDSNYTCTYYPFVKYYDSDNNQYVMLPATKDVVRNMAQTDNTSFPWFAPAGFNRGDVDCVKAHFVTKLGDEDTLYEGRINPLKSFSGEGVKLWGQKNLQIAESQLNRIAVRRLMLRIRKLISIACNRLIFEPNDATTKNRFLSLVTPILDSVKSNRGISDYRIEVDDSVEARERRELNCKVFIKVINALEYISIDFVITPENVSFDNI